MTPQLLAAIASTLDFLLTRLETAGEDIPEHIIQDRNTIRRALVAESNDLADPQDGD